MRTDASLKPPIQNSADQIQIYTPQKKIAVWQHYRISLSCNQVTVLKSFSYKFAKGVSTNLWRGYGQNCGGGIPKKEEDNNTSINTTFNIKN